MPVWLNDDEYAVAAAACERLIPATDRGPGAGAAGVADYLDQLLGAFTFDPPRIWAGGPTSGRHGRGPPAFADFHPLSAPRRTGLADPDRGIAGTARARVQRTGGRAPGALPAGAGRPG